MYTIEKWREFKKANKLKNKDIAEILGTSTSNVERYSLKSTKKLPTWMRGMLWAYYEALKK